MSRTLCGLGGSSFHDQFRLGRGSVSCVGRGKVGGVHSRTRSFIEAQLTPGCVPGSKGRAPVEKRPIFVTRRTYTYYYEKYLGG